MENKNKLANPPQKVLLMYQAVADMIKEGADINSMKVSDITARAGIGKGTAYEYFSSKEEIITKALTYDVEQKMQALSEIIDSHVSFKELMAEVFDYVEEKFGENQTFCNLVRIGTGAYEVSAAFHKEEWVKQLPSGKIEQLIDRIMQCGQDEGVIREKNVELNRMAFSAQILAFATWQVAAGRGKTVNVSAEEAKQFAYEALVKSLN